MKHVAGKGVSAATVRWTSMQSKHAKGIKAIRGLAWNPLKNLEELHMLLRIWPRNEHQRATLRWGGGCLVPPSPHLTPKSYAGYLFIARWTDIRYADMRTSLGSNPGPSGQPKRILTTKIFTPSTYVSSWLRKGEQFWSSSFAFKGNWQRDAVLEVIKGGRWRGIDALFQRRNSRLRWSKLHLLCLHLIITNAFIIPLCIVQKIQIISLTTMLVSDHECLLWIIEIEFRIAHYL